MNWKMLKKISDAPDKGWMLIYLRKEIIFDKYDCLSDVQGRIGDNEILEMHLFNRDKEYRVVASTGALYKKENGVIEYIADFQNDSDTYREKVLLEIPGKQMTVLNHLKYDSDNGMAGIDDYRLVMND